jgi:hypothetical protein
VPALCAVLAALLLACGGQTQTGAEAGAASDRLAEDLIAEAYFRSFLSSPEAEPGGLVFLSFGRAQDPPFMFLKRFRQSGFEVRPISQCDRQAPVARDRETGEEGILVALSRVNLVTPRRAIASGHFSKVLTEGRSYTCVLEKDAEGRWAVTSSTVNDLQ